MTYVQAYKEVEELNRLRRDLGVLIHAPLHLLVVGGMLSLLGMLETLWVQVEDGVFIFVCVVAVVVLLIATVIFVRFVQAAWEAFHPNGSVQRHVESRKVEEAAIAKADRIAEEQERTARTARST